MRCGILSAILIPDEQIARKLPAHLAPVNLFRFLFREYFGAARNAPQPHFLLGGAHRYRHPSAGQPHPGRHGPIESLIRASRGSRRRTQTRPRRPSRGPMMPSRTGAELKIRRQFGSSSHALGGTLVRVEGV